MGEGHYRVLRPRAECSRQDDSMLTYREAEPFTTKVKHVDCSKAISDLKYDPRSEPRRRLCEVDRAAALRGWSYCHRLTLRALGPLFPPASCRVGDCEKRKERRMVAVYASDVLSSVVSFLGSNRNPYLVFTSEDQETFARRLCESSNLFLLSLFYCLSLSFLDT